MILKLALTAAAGCAFTETVGYFLHILLHSEKIAWLSRGHMIHHLKIYGPRRSLRQPGPYKDSVEGRWDFLGIGAEWLLPIVLILGGTVAVCSVLLKIPAASQAVFMAAALLWGKFMFGDMHDSMHLEGYWMATNPVLGVWYRKIRRLHDIHHLRFSEEGRMPTNFGICFFGFDRLFGTFYDNAEAFNENGYQAALRRYAEVIA
ncbi:MAG: sterol desaturase family protein [Elusimicrobia bacterium]|nr:sterol desaturase family protein [Elusimicrobiota bacterium]